jgi:two-component system phosphate regulon sensor histidine kinase PhoR
MDRRRMISKIKNMKQLQWLVFLMCITLAAITGFQAYWLKNSYRREQLNLDIKSRAAFRQAVMELQTSKLKFENVFVLVDSAKKALRKPKVNSSPAGVLRLTKSFTGEPPVSVANLIQQKLRDSLGSTFLNKRILFISVKDSPASRLQLKARSPQTNGIRAQAENDVPGAGKLDSLDPSRIKEIRIVSGFGKPGADTVRDRSTHLMFRKADSFRIREDGSGSENYNVVYNIDSLSDSLGINEIDSAFTLKQKNGRFVTPFLVRRFDHISAIESLLPDDVIMGFNRPVAYRLYLLNPFYYLLKQLWVPIIFSLFLIGITLLSFWLLYRNVLRQRRLAVIKNEFINNVTHELKTPIATVSVALESLKNFNAIHDPERTREYLDISSHEMQRLSTLVDKVLTLSGFEKNNLRIKYEDVALAEIVEETVASLKPRIENRHAVIGTEQKGDTCLKGDRIQLAGIVFNLVDNALKYSEEGVHIRITVEENGNTVELRVADTGMGIPPEYRHRIFETFFRVPHGDTHNAKGHGLGLSYVSSVVAHHNGRIRTDSQLGEGTTFTITLPKKAI